MATLRQPIIDPQFVGGQGMVQPKEVFTPWMDTRAAGDVLIDVARRLGKPMADSDTRAAVRKTWAKLGQADLTADTTENDTAWVNALSQGGVWTDSPPAPNPGGCGTRTESPGVLACCALHALC